jgi:hypothetical protein
MKVETLKAAKEEARRFLKKVTALESESKNYKHTGCIVYGGRSAAAVKRSSLDLTMKLADLRQDR